MDKLDANMEKLQEDTAKLNDFFYELEPFLTTRQIKGYGNLIGRLENHLDKLDTNISLLETVL